MIKLFQFLRGHRAAQSEAPLDNGMGSRRLTSSDQEQSIHERLTPSTPSSLIRASLDQQMHIPVTPNSKLRINQLFPLFPFQRRSLTGKLAVSMTGVILVAIGSITTLSIHREQAAFKVELQQEADLLLDTLEMTAADWLHSSTADDLLRLMKVIKDNNSLVVGGYIFDANGHVIANLQHDY
ncbi:MAG: hypothetical protein AAFU78_19255, partial [Cyanobacteria bacterium J06633_2]